MEEKRPLARRAKPGKISEVLWQTNCAKFSRMGSHPLLHLPHFQKSENGGEKPAAAGLLRKKKRIFLP
jgi:hypothetical protein